MKRAAWIFVLAVFLPSLVLGLLALRTAREQSVILERQASALRQQETDAAAQTIREALFARQAEFIASVQTFLKSRPPQVASVEFYRNFSNMWGDGSVPFATSLNGVICSPRATDAAPAALEFLKQNSALLGNSVEVEFFQTQKSANSAENQKVDNAYAAKAAYVQKMEVAGKTGTAKRNVLPQKLPAEDKNASDSQLAPEISNFRKVVQNASDGILARFVENKLEVIFWMRGPDNLVFGLMLPASQLNTLVQNSMPSSQGRSNDACMAVLNENTVPVAQSPPGFKANWKHPFVATEIGDSLPHWEVALYLAHPEQFETSARSFTFILLALIGISLGAICVGGYLVVSDARRQMALAEKKTNFVSNVSHELKTPLTSIRMFSELLQKPGIDESRRIKYLRIITLESERLTRLINNVLDFARMEGKRKSYQKHEVDLYPVIERAWESQSAHLQESGFTTAWHAAEPPYPVLGDEDALAQVLVNLLSNAEKYSTTEKSIELHTYFTDMQLCIAVLDRGIGVAPGQETKIFEAFYRSDDSLSSGVQGSGLGLTLARRIAEDHEGSIRLEARQGGGSTFTFCIPISKKSIHEKDSYR